MLKKEKLYMFTSLSLTELSFLTLINVVLHQYMFAVCRIVRPGMEDYTEPFFNGSDAAGDSFVEGQAN